MCAVDIKSTVKSPLFREEVACVGLFSSILSVRDIVVARRVGSEADVFLNLWAPQYPDGPNAFVADGVSGETAGMDEPEGGSALPAKRPRE